jgi:alpha-mannosidase
MGYFTICVKFADLSEHGYGVAILSESKYGFSCQGDVLRISLLRAATAPDADQDQGSCLPQKIGAQSLYGILFTQASMNFHGPFCPTVVTSSSPTSPLRRISSTHRCTVRPTST